MNQTSGWWLPQGDEYFGKFVIGQPPKRNGFQREHLQEAFQHVRAWDVAIDCGAHVGFWARDMAERFSKVYAFEAAADTFACLERNMADHPNVEVRHAAVGLEGGLCRVDEDSTRKGNTGSRFVQRDKHGDVEIVALDSLSLPGCDLLKVDVEGHEWHVLKGAEKLIKAHRPVVIMETDKAFAMARYGVPDDAAERFLLKRGYRVVAHMRPDKVLICD